MTLEIIAQDPQIKGVDVVHVISEIVSGDSSLDYSEVCNSVINWAGRETDILGILMHASEKGKGGKYLARLNELYKNELSRAPVAKGGRQMPLGPVLRTKASVLRMYQELGVELSSEDTEFMNRYSN